MRLYRTANRDESHLELEKVLASGDHPMAHCREDPNDPEGLCYSVWSDSADIPLPVRGPVDPSTLGPVSERDRAALDQKLGVIREEVQKISDRLEQPPMAPPETPPSLSDGDVDRIAERLAQILGKRG